MFGTDYSDFFDSDDDAFLAEVSNSLPDCTLSTSESLTKLENHSLKHKHKHIINSSYSEYQEEILSYKEDINPKVNKVALNVDENSRKDAKPTISTSLRSDFTHTGPSPAQSGSSSSVLASNKHMSTPKTSSFFNNQVQTATDSTHDPDSVNHSLNKGTFTSGTSYCINSQANVATDTSTKLQSSSSAPTFNKNASTPENSSYINNRFTPGFTPKAKKRKFPGPAGLLELPYESNMENPVPCGSRKIYGSEMEFEPIISSQFSMEHLSLSSWKKLQTDVSSHSNLHSTAKFYCIQRVLQESSKKKLPKHMLVPVLCVLLKEIKKNGTSTVTIFMDDTGEINGKIDADILSKYNEYMVVGTALILKKITFLCNMLMLKLDNLVSMYLPDGTVNHLQSLESVLDTSEPLKPMNCDCLKLSHVNRNNFFMASHNRGTSGYHHSNCVSEKQNITSNVQNQRNAMAKIASSIRSSPSLSKSFAPAISHGNIIPVNQKTGSVSHLQNVPSNVTHCNASSARLSSSSLNKSSAPVKSIRSDKFLEDLLTEENEFDEFDELLGNLDEKSFLDSI